MLPKNKCIGEIGVDVKQNLGTQNRRASIT